MFSRMQGADHGPASRVPRPRRIAIGVVGLAAMALSGVAEAQTNTSSAALDWSGNYAFGGPAEKALRLQQADLIERKDKGYYSKVGDAYYEVHNDNSTNIEQQTNSTGSVNNSQTDVDFNGSGNSFSGSHGAYSYGCQDGSIDISSPGTDVGASRCN